MNNKIDHLSDWQIEELLISPSETRGCTSSQCDAQAHDQDQARLHLENCPLCNSKKERLEKTVFLYREAALLKAEDAFQHTAASHDSLAAHEPHSSFSFRLFWRWQARALAFLLLLAILIPAFVARERERHEAQQAARNHLAQAQVQEQAQAKDDLLLRQVDQEITESVPQPMQSLTQPFLDDGSKDE